MTHQQIVQQYKENLKADWHDQDVPMDFALDFLAIAMTAAAKGAAEAGKLQKESEEEDPGENRVQAALYGHKRGRNHAISQSEEWLRKYFEEI